LSWLHAFFFRTSFFFFLSVLFGPLSYPPFFTVLSSFLVHFVALLFEVLFPLPCCLFPDLLLLKPFSYWSSLYTSTLPTVNQSLYLPYLLGAWT
jgi:hypothetical protein